MRAMPTTTVPKMIGASVMRISLMNPSPSGLRVIAAWGKNTPARTPRTMPIAT